MTEESRVPLNRIERILATMIVTVGGLSLLSILAVTIAGMVGVSDFSGGVWPTILVLPFPGLLIAAALIVVLLVMSVVRRRRIARDGAE